MYSILTCQYIIASMYARWHFIPILTSIFVTVFTLMKYYFPILFCMRYTTFILIVKCRLSLYDMFNPFFHMRSIWSECMINVLFPYFTHILQMRQMSNCLAQSLFLLTVWEQLKWSHFLLIFANSYHKCSCSTTWIAIVFEIKDFCCNIVMSS